MAPENQWRASDRDREQTAERLRHAAAEGRLSPEEFEERVRVAFAARTYGELAAVVRDLPSPLTEPSSHRPARTPWFTRGRPGAVVAGLLALVMMVLILALAAVTVRRHASVAPPMPTVTSAVPGPQP